MPRDGIWEMGSYPTFAVVFTNGRFGPFVTFMATRNDPIAAACAFRLEGRIAALRWINRIADKGKQAINWRYMSSMGMAQNEVCLQLRALA
jgi:hypothetical protein